MKWVDSGVESILEPVDQRELGGVRIDALTFEQLFSRLKAWSQDRQGGYACPFGSVTLVEAARSAEFKRAVNSADLVFADGMPTVWFLRLSGVRNAQRVPAPDLVFKLCEMAASAGIPVGFYGSTQDTLDRARQNLQSSYPALEIRFMMSPPFRPLSLEEDEKVVDAINHSGTGLLFVGLGCPKQELWMAAHRTSVKAVTIGMGAAFDIAAGKQRAPPRVIQVAGMQWLYRLSKEPRRLWKRYLVANPLFLYLVVKESLKRLSR